MTGVWLFARVSKRSNAHGAWAISGAWLDGYEHERRLDLAAKITPEQRAEAASVAQRLRDFANTL